MNRSTVPAEAFFLPMRHGPERRACASFPTSESATHRFCLYYPPNPSKAVRGAFIYVPPFAEEMNRARRMAALQARRFADAGYGVLVIDLLGCGDSSGDFGDAGWDLWKADLAAARDWLENRLSTRIGLWGLRLGALLALDVARSAPHQFSSLILWNPVVSGSAFMTQFLRLHLGADLAAQGKNSGGTRASRAALASGETLEIAGYRIAPDLADAIDRLHAETLIVNQLPIHWIDVLRISDTPSAAAAAGNPPRISPAADTVVSRWRLQNVDVNTHAVGGLPFWATPETSICQPLLELTTGIAALAREE